MSSLKKRGFTLIELLFVVSIISLLSSVILGAVGESREKAQFTKLVQDLKQMENALNLMRSDYNSWLDELVLVGSANPTIQTMISSPNNTLKRYLATEPIFPIRGESNVRYAFDSDVGIPFVKPTTVNDANCNPLIGNGVNILIGVNPTYVFSSLSASNATFLKLNDVFDPGEKNMSEIEKRCSGKIRKHSGESIIIYSISDTF